ncbi:amidohydrolase family protein [Flammeovirga agarivorans]|uniref:Membrane dipeptidase (Peptidase family M19) n=1 Tax=Flammeovirga agarivorans TaxID=2726742 RepID=A0A7X8SJZ9_9BACT|nr:membrane dipeptidase [Flammeovirga agarivorans]NLR91644.1 hypothetical protein [Flammeovirga agarivorans]
MTKFADFHIHLSLKHLINKGEEGRKDIWDSIRYNPSKHKPKRASSDKYDQSDLSLLVDENVKMAVIALHPVEVIVRKSWVNRLIGKFIFGFELDRLKKWAQDSVKSFSILNRELEVVFSLPDKDDYRKNFPSHLAKGNRRAIFPTNADELNDEETTKLFLSVEGAHALSNLPFEAQGEELEKEVLKNLHHLQYERNIPIFSLTLCHFANNYLFKQSWALPLPKVVDFLKIPGKDLLESQEEPINKHGLKVIDQCLDPSKGKRILIDTKHLHIDARYVYYQLLLDKGPNPLDTSENPSEYYAPIIASHSGVSGMRNKEEALQVGRAKREGHKNKYQRFNPWEINICDEELPIIMKSKGMIGISLDQRILGTENNDYVKAVCNHLKDKYGKVTWRKMGKAKRTEMIHAALFLDNLLYIVHKMGSEKAWDCICIGSDFDGVIDPIDCCPTVSYFSSFEKLLVDDFDKLRYKAEEEIYIPNGKSLQTLFRGVFYDNLERFIKDNFCCLPSSVPLESIS